MKQIFLDTSIQIARWIREPEMKRRIDERLKQYEATTTSLVVRQEFKRRLLKEAQYLLNQLADKGSLEKVHRHIISVLPPQQQRKRNICLEMLATVFEGKPDDELTERAQRYLRTLLRVGLSDFDNSVSQVVEDTNCACAQQPITEKIPYRQYEFGTDKCGQTGGVCGVSKFLDDHQSTVEQIQTHLKQLPADKKSAELQATESFIEKTLDEGFEAKELNPCLTVGDLLIALESAAVSDFYTLNSKESQHLCRALRQSLIVRPKNPAHEDVVCQATDETWREF